MSMAELIGYAGSVIILISLLMKSLVKLRWINLAGSILFSLYGLMIRAWPVFGINAVIVGIDAWFLYQMMRLRDYFDLSPLAEIGAEYFKKFFLYHENDIQSFFPGTPFESLIGAETHMLFRNMLPVGFLAMRLEGEEARVVADYVVPEYRDFKIGVFVYEIKRMYFKEKGIKRFVAESGNVAHRKYLRRNGFRPDPTRPDLFVKAL
ncbi:MAG: hypothetical protein KKC51_08540 [Verrucomicrobia bacterium]|nr:hypothetical protein [Verrucomicrobiota bacterium]